MSPEHSQITKAFVEAGINPPSIREQLWRIVKENSGLSGISSKEIMQRASHVKVGTIGSTLSAMEDLGMIYSKPAGIHGADRHRKLYFTDLAEYKVPPKEKKEKTEKPKKLAAVTPMAVAETPRPMMTRSEGIDLEQLTIAQARALYNWLHKMFGG